LELHPDKNYGNAEESTALFAEVQSAYEVLSDPQERAWYDSHRDAILFGGSSAQDGQFFHSTKITTSEELIGYFAKFGSSVQFTDSPTGFFGGLREIFDRLANEEALACNWEGLEPTNYPSFGSKNDDHPVARDFYSAWGGFATKKSFSWKDVYRPSDAPDRRVRRLMEKENKRIREEAIREFNDAVRSLVAFSKKRDPRFKPNAQSESQRQAALREAAAAQAARSRAANVVNLNDFTLPEWARPEDQYESETETETEPEQDTFACDICRKYFKSEKQFEAHERSKKHIKAVRQVQRTMRYEDSQFELDASEPNSGISTPPHPVSTQEPGPELSAAEGEEDEQAPFDEQPACQDSMAETSTGQGSTYGDHPKVENGNVSADEGDATAETSEHSDGLSDIENRFSNSTIADQPPPKLGKAKQKREKKSAQMADAGMMCSTCKTPFPSRTKLFSHIRALGHAQPVGRPQSSPRPTRKG
jgi:DnaJ family protein A protein 5